jgi:hypothetical protein
VGLVGVKKELAVALLGEFLVFLYGIFFIGKEAQINLLAAKLSGGAPPALPLYPVRRKTPSFRAGI